MTSPRSDRFRQRTDGSRGPRDRVHIVAYGKGIRIRFAQQAPGQTGLAHSLKVGRRLPVVHHHNSLYLPGQIDTNGPLRGHKRDLYEGGIRAPFLARWPAAISPGTTSDHISAFWDILPTMAELTGQPVPEQNDGISMLAAMKGDPSQK